MQIRRKDDRNNLVFSPVINFNRPPKSFKGINIYIGNLSQDITEDDLREAFGSFGRIENVKLIKDRESGEPKGFGFVEMPTLSEGRSAISSLNGTELKGQTLKVSEARSQSHNNRNNGGQTNGPRFY